MRCPCAADTSAKRSAKIRRGQAALSHASAMQFPDGLGLGGKHIGDVILDVNNISLSFGGVKALQDISFNVIRELPKSWS